MGQRYKKSFYKCKLKLVIFKYVEFELSLAVNGS